MAEVFAELIAKAIAGDIGAFEEIYRALSGFVYSVAVRITRNEHDAQEVTQDVFMNVYHNLKNFRGESTLRTWIYRITTNAALNACRSRNRRTRGQVQLEEDSPVFADTLTQEEQRRHAEAAGQIEKRLACLNPQQRACLILRTVHGLSYEEIAGQLGIPLNTVRSRLLRAREALINFEKRGDT